jgi:hypothetical protein
MSDAYEIEVIDIVDQDDGSAIMEIKMCPEASRLVIEAGLLSLIKKHIDEIENESKIN